MSAPFDPNKSQGGWFRVFNHREGEAQYGSLKTIIPNPNSKTKMMIIIYYLGATSIDKIGEVQLSDEKGEDFLN